jgi:hypothetical protein
MTKPPKRVKALLRLPKNDVPKFIFRARAIVQGMTGNAWFPSPDPTLAAIAAATEALDAAQTATLSGLIGTVPARDEKRQRLKSLLQQECAYIQAIADANPEHAMSIIEGAGCRVEMARTVRPRTFRVRRGKVSGSVRLSAPWARDTSYEWQQSGDGETWTSLPATMRAYTIVTGLTPGSRVFFRYRTVTTKVESDWSDALSIIVD